MSNDGNDDRPRLAEDRKARAIMAEFLKPKKGGQSNPGGYNKMKENEMDQNYSIMFGTLLSKIDYKWTDEYQMMVNANRAVTHAKNNVQKKERVLESCEKDVNALAELILKEYGTMTFEEMPEQAQREVLKKEGAIEEAKSMMGQAYRESAKELEACIKATKTYTSMKNLTTTYEQMSVGFMFNSARTYHEKESETCTKPRTSYLGTTIAGVIALFLEHPKPKYRKEIIDIFDDSKGNRYITAALGALVKSSFLYKDDTTSKKKDFFSLNGHYCHELPLTFCRLPEGVDGDLDLAKFRNNYELFKQGHKETPYYNHRPTVTEEVNNVFFPIMPHVREIRIKKRSGNYEENMFTHPEVIEII